MRKAAEWLWRPGYYTGTKLNERSLENESRHIVALCDITPEHSVRKGCGPNMICILVPIFLSPSPAAFTQLYAVYGQATPRLQHTLLVLWSDVTELLAQCCWFRRFSVT